MPRSIAVLPFENKSGDTSYDYLAEGMSDEVRSQLTKVTGLAVMARSSSMALKSQSTDARDVGAKLKVASILQGSVSRAGGRLHVTAEVVRTDDGTAVWSETFDQDADHLSTIRDSVARAVTAALRLSVGARTARVEDPVARDYYLRGHYLSMKTSDTALRQSLVYFGKALERDPTFAEAQAGIAWTWAFLADAYLSPAEAYPKTKVAALKAIALDSLLPEGHLALAMAQAFHDWDFTAAEHSLRRAIELRPRYAEAHSTYGVLLSGMGRFPEAIAQVDSAVQLDPLSLVPGFQRAWVLYTAGRYREAIAQVRRSNEIDAESVVFRLIRWAGISGARPRRLGARCIHARKAVSEWSAARRPCGTVRASRTEAGGEAVAHELENGIAVTTMRQSTLPSRGQTSAISIARSCGSRRSSRSALRSGSCSAPAASLRHCARTLAGPRSSGARAVSSLPAPRIADPSGASSPHGNVIRSEAPR